jgi:hypothetical protein
METMTVRRLRSLFHANSAAHAFIVWASEKRRFQLSWRWRRLFEQLRQRDPSMTRREFVDFFRDVLPKIQFGGAPLRHFPPRARLITFHAEVRSLARRVMRPGRPSFGLAAQRDR